MMYYRHKDNIVMLINDYIEFAFYICLAKGMAKVSKSKTKMGEGVVEYGKGYGNIRWGLDSWGN